VRGKPRFTERDVKRAIRAAQNAGLKVGGFEVRPDGVIAIMSADSSVAAVEANPFDLEAERLRRRAS
jgi:hypothetical protein